jgi:hypothetical protein
MPMSTVGRWDDVRVPDLDESAVARLLLTHWDVVGVADVDVQPEVEYKHEASGVLALLKAGAAVCDVAAYLGEASSSLHATPDGERDRLAAQAVWDAYTG